MIRALVCVLCAAVASASKSPQDLMDFALFEWFWEHDGATAVEMSPAGGGTALQDASSDWMLFIAHTPSPEWDPTQTVTLFDREGLRVWYSGLNITCEWTSAGGGFRRVIVQSGVAADRAFVVTFIGDDATGIETKWGVTGERLATTRRGSLPSATQTTQMPVPTELRATSERVVYGETRAGGERPLPGSRTHGVWFWAGDNVNMIPNRWPHRASVAFDFRRWGENEAPGNFGEAEVALSLTGPKTAVYRSLPVVDRQPGHEGVNLERWSQVIDAARAGRPVVRLVEGDSTSGYYGGDYVADMSVMPRFGDELGVRLLQRPVDQDARSAALEVLMLGTLTPNLNIESTWAWRGRDTGAEKHLVVDTPDAFGISADVHRLGFAGRFRKRPAAGIADTDESTFGNWNYPNALEAGESGTLEIASVIYGAQASQLRAGFSRQWRFPWLRAGDPFRLYSIVLPGLSDTIEGSARFDLEIARDNGSPLPFAATLTADRLSEAEPDPQLRKRIRYDLPTDLAQVGVPFDSIEQDRTVTVPTLALGSSQSASDAYVIHSVPIVLSEIDSSGITFEESGLPARLENARMRYEGPINVFYHGIINESVEGSISFLRLGIGGTNVIEQAAKYHSRTDDYALAERYEGAALVLMKGALLQGEGRPLIAVSHVDGFNSLRDSAISADEWERHARACLEYWRAVADLAGADIVYLFRGFHFLTMGDNFAVFTDRMLNLANEYDFVCAVDPRELYGQEAIERNRALWGLYDASGAVDAVHQSWQGAAANWISIYEFAGVSSDGCFARCNAADFSPPCGVLTFADVSTFVQYFGDGLTGADLASPFGEFTFADVSAFLSAFTSGCP
jgi:hypothetical protein